MDLINKIFAFIFGCFITACFIACFVQLMQPAKTGNTYNIETIEKVEIKIDVHVADPAVIQYPKIPCQ